MKRSKIKFAEDTIPPVPRLLFWTSKVTEFIDGDGERKEGVGERGIEKRHTHCGMINRERELQAYSNHFTPRRLCNVWFTVYVCENILHIKKPSQEYHSVTITDGSAGEKSKSKSKSKSKREIERERKR